MRIQSSTILMQSSHTYESSYEKKSASLITSKEQADSLFLSDESKTLSEQLQDENARLEKETKEQEKERLANLVANQKEKTNGTQNNVIHATSKDEMQIEILKRLLEALKRMRSGKYPVRSDLRQLQQGLKTDTKLPSQVPSFSSMGQNAVSIAPTTWVKTTVNSEFYQESEQTAYQANGIVKTADGREISFNVSVEMSRSFCQRNESFVQENYICTDPLMIQLDGNVASVSDQKFLFDLDSDGKEEEISFADKGNAFLALDKNKDGTINDGSELFGTKSGDGFKDLAAYDKDKNGWIDEGDEVFDQLKVWSKDEQGKDKLISLKDAGIGAIYLGSSNTEFSLKDDDNRTNAIVRKTGMYLRENGTCGTISHVDLAV